LPPTAEKEGTFKFDIYTLDLRARELHKDGRKIRIQEQPCRILAMLLEQPGQVVTREELRDRLWSADTFVDFDHSLNTAVKKLRQALNDEAESPRFIETIAKRGYRYIGPQVEKLPGSQSSAAGSTVPASNLTSTTGKASATRWRVALALVLILGAIGLGVFLLRHQVPKLTEKDTIVLADFDNTTGDAVFDDTLKQGLAVQLAQSPFLSILSDERVRETLKLMGRPSGERLTPEIARDLCQRTDGAAVIAGSIATLQDQFVVGLNALDCHTGENLVREQVASEDKRHVLAALGKAAQDLRRRLGESLSTLQKYGTPIEQATTPSLEALKAYSLGRKTSAEKGEVAAIPFFERAIELDPNFAAAYAALGDTYVALGEPGLAKESLVKAYELRDRVSDAEKFDITSHYHTSVTGDLEKANQTCELWARAYPRDREPHLLLAYNYELVGRYDKAISENLEAIQLDPDVALLYSNLMEDYTPLNRLYEAKTTYRTAVDRHLESSFLHADMYLIAFLESDAAEMQRQIKLVRDMPGAEDWLFSEQSDTAAYFGQLAEAGDLSRQAVQSAQRNDLKEVSAIWQMNMAIREAEFGNVQKARSAVELGLGLASTKDSQAIAALVLARIGDASRALAFADVLQKQFPQNAELNNYWLPSIRAAIQLNHNSPAEALQLLETTAPYESGYPRPQVEGGSLLYPAYLRGQAFLLLHRGTEARAEFQKFIDQRAAVANCPFGSLAHLWLGRAHVAEGDTSAARDAYEQFLNLWKNADPDIPILKEAKAEYAKLQ
jgi:DNA-binding winged helix-turn-helix (wHTH) protein/tetratricopeptide (TPR) repeat protein